MSESNATAVAEKPNTTIETPGAAAEATPPVEARPEGTAPSAEDKGSAQVPSAESTPSAEGEANASGFDAALAKVRGKPAKTAAPALPGRTLDDEWFELTSKGGVDYASVMQTTEAEFRESVKDLDLSAEAVHNLWQYMRNKIEPVHTKNLQHNLTMLDTYLRDALSDEAKALLEGRTYVVRDGDTIKPYSTMKEAFKVGVEAEKAARDKQWEAKLEAGDILTRKDAEAVAEAMVVAARAEWEKAGPSASSGQRMSGGGISGSRNPDDVLSDPDASAEAKNIAFEQKYGFKPS